MIFTAENAEKRENQISGIILSEAAGRNRGGPQAGAQVEARGAFCWGMKER